MPSYSSPPAGSSIDLAEVSESRLVMVIPPGGERARGMGCFAILWLAISIPAGIIFLSAAASGDVEWEGGNRPPVWGVFLFFSIFWSVGLGMGYLALKMQFEHLMLCLEPDRLSIQRVFFGWTKMTWMQLNDNSRAVLRESYSENDVPVYRLEIAGSSETEKFGTALSRQEKQWIAVTFNEFLGHEAETLPDHAGDQSCADCGSPLVAAEGRRICLDCKAVFYDDNQPQPEQGPLTSARKPCPDVRPDRLPPDTELTVEDCSDERLVVSFLLNPNTGVRIFAGGGCLTFSLLWMGISCLMAWMALPVDRQAGSILMALLCGAFCCVGFLPLSFGLAILFARNRITVSRQWLSMRCHLGPIQFGAQRVETDSVQNVLLEEKHKTTTHSSSRRIPADSYVVSAETSGKSLLLTSSSNATTGSDLCGLVRYQLHRMGFQLLNN